MVELSLIFAFALIAYFLKKFFDLPKKPALPYNEDSLELKRCSLNLENRDLLDVSSAETYTFDGLPPKVKMNVLRRRSRIQNEYEYYNPRPLPISSPPHTAYEAKNEFSDRAYVARSYVNRADLFAIVEAAETSLNERLKTSIFECETAFGKYPVKKPISIGEIQPPAAPTMFTSNQLCSEEILTTLSSKEKAYVIGYVDTVNLKRQNDYDSAVEKFHVAIEATKFAQEKAVVHWSKVAQEWDSTCLSEKNKIIALRECVKSTWDVESILRLALMSAKLPDWIPNTLRLSFDADEGVIIVEHQFPLLEEIEWFKIVSLKNLDVLKPLPATEREKVFSEFYSLLTLALAVIVAKNSDPTKVKFIAINGWVDFRSKDTGAEKRAFCSSLAAPTTEIQKNPIGSCRSSCSFKDA